MEPNTVDPFLIPEASRIREAYSRRQGLEGRYDGADPGHRFIVAEREKAALSFLKDHAAAGLHRKGILEVGCGKGDWLRTLLRWGARPENLAGVDLLEERVAEARRLCPPGVRIDQGDASQLKFPDASFDIVLQSTVFTSILDSVLKRRVASEMLRVLKPGGVILWYDFFRNNPWNPDVRGVGRAEIRDLFPGCGIDLEAITLVPPLARRIAPFSTLACALLAKIPFLRTHYLGIIRKS